MRSTQNQTPDVIRGKLNPYLLALVLVIMAVAMRYLLHPLLQAHSPFLVFTLAVVASAVYGGLKSALLATFLSAGVGWYLFIAPHETSNELVVQNYVSTLLFVCTGIALSILGGRLFKNQYAAETSEERFKLMVEGTQDTAIFFVSASGEVQSWNSGAQRIMGYSEDEALGKSISMFYAEEDLKDALSERLREAAKKSGYTKDEGWRVRKDGSRFWAVVTLTALYDKNGKLTGFSKVTRDLTRERDLLIALQESEQTSRALLESATQAVVGINRQGEIRLANRAAEKMFGYAREELLGQPIEMLMPDSSRRQHIQQRSSYFEDAYPRPMGQGLELSGQKKSGEIFPIEASLSMTDTPSGPMAVSFVTDITKRKQIENDLLKEKSQLRSILDNSPVLVSIKDLEGKFILANRSLADALQVMEEHLISKSVFEIFPEEDARKIWSSDQTALQTGNTLQREEKFRQPDGEERSYLTVTFPVSYLDTAEPFGVCEFSVDITEQKNAEEKILHAARHDPLTGLPNRALIYELGNLLLHSAKRTKSKFAVLFFDLDRFKPINDTYGHEAGDLMLQEVAHRLNSNVRESDLVGRLGGDEFVAVLTNLPSENEVVRLASHLLDALRQPYHIKGLELRTSPSIGISLFTEDGQDIDTLIRHADAAMYHAKANGRNTYQFFSPEINVNTQRVFALEQKLRQSLEESDFELFYQPIIDTHTLQVAGAEALIRWRPNNGEIVLPGEFIMAAETSGLIHKLGNWALQQACRQHTDWCKQGLPPLRIAVNVSPIQFRGKDFQQNVADAVLQSGIDPACLELEVTESTIMKHVEDAAKTLGDLKDLGLRISLDDFGTGYSSLSYLSQFPIDKLKVDQSFIKHLDTDSRSLAITETVIALAKKLGVAVVAEGIESEEAFDILRDRECDLAQGYLIGRPMQANHFAEWYKQTEAGRLYH